MSILVLFALIQADPSVEAALERFKIAYKAKEASARAQAVAELAKTSHEKVHAKLGLLLGVDEKEVRLAAAKALGEVTDTPEHKDFRKKAAQLLAKGIAPNAKDPGVIVAIVQALEKITEGLGIEVLKQNMALPNTDVAKGSVEAAGELKEKALVDPLIKVAAWLEAKSREASNLGPGGKKVTGGGLPYVDQNAVDPEAPRRAKIVIPAIYKSLEAITGKSFKTTKEWEDWWKREGPGFKVGP
jgi:hypothetical protein